MPTSPVSLSQEGSSALQSQLWSARARDWAEIQEPTAMALYEAALAVLKLKPGSEVLDAGCGSGLFCQLAAQAGHNITGFDATPALLAIARERLPRGEFFACDLEQQPFADNTFDAVTGFNSFQYAARPLRALTEAQRVLKPGGHLIMATWGRPEDCEATAYLQALSGLMPPPPPGAPGPFALSSDGAMAALTTQAGFQTVAELQVLTVWDYPDEPTALRGLMSAGPAIRVGKFAGEDVAEDAVRKVLTRFKQADGHYRMRNTFRYVVVRK
jgi:SAM-dependent methyltransferase